MGMTLPIKILHLSKVTSSLRRAHSLGGGSQWDQYPMYSLTLPISLRTHLFDTELNVQCYLRRLLGKYCRGQFSVAWCRWEVNSPTAWLSCSIHCLIRWGHASCICHFYSHVWIIEFEAFMHSLSLWCLWEPILFNYILDYISPTWRVFRISFLKWHSLQLLNLEEWTTEVLWLEFELAQKKCHCIFLKVNFLSFS